VERVPANQITIQLDILFMLRRLPISQARHSPLGPRECRGSSCRTTHNAQRTTHAAPYNAWHATRGRERARDRGRVHTRRSARAREGPQLTAEACWSGRPDR
jgi:hypothetical protein